jgi:lipopolysaccharide heptosyltransferase II
LLRALKERFAHSRLIMIADAAYAPLFAHHPWVDEFWAHAMKKTERSGSELWNMWQTVQRLRRANVDVYIDLYGSMRTALWGFLAGIPKRLGFALRGRKYFYTQAIVAKERYVVRLNLQFAQQLGWQGTDDHLEFFLTPQEIVQAKQHLLDFGWKPPQPLVVISPGGGWPVKCWGAQRFAAVAKQLAQMDHCFIVFSGSAAEAELVQQTAQGCTFPHGMAVGLSLRLLAGIISQAQLFLGNDSGPKYFAESYDIPSLICYGPTDEKNNHPLREPHRALAQKVDCRPCHSEICREPYRRCLDDLSVETVVRNARELLKPGVPG